jgi:hypothetical protein
MAGFMWVMAIISRCNATLDIQPGALLDITGSYA